MTVCCYITYAQPLAPVLSGGVGIRTGCTSQPPPSLLRTRQEWFRDSTAALTPAAACDLSTKSPVRLYPREGICACKQTPVLCLPARCPAACGGRRQSLSATCRGRDSSRGLAAEAALWRGNSWAQLDAAAAGWRPEPEVHGEVGWAAWGWSMVPPYK